MKKFLGIALAIALVSGCSSRRREMLPCGTTTTSDTSSGDMVQINGLLDTCEQAPSGSDCFGPYQALAPYDFQPGPVSGIKFNQVNDWVMVVLHRPAFAVGPVSIQNMGILFDFSSANCEKYDTVFQWAMIDEGSPLPDPRDVTVAWNFTPIAASEITSKWEIMNEAVLNDHQAIVLALQMTGDAPGSICIQYQKALAGPTPSDYWVHTNRGPSDSEIDGIAEFDLSPTPKDGMAIHILGLYAAGTWSEPASAGP